MSAITGIPSIAMRLGTHGPPPGMFGLIGGSLGRLGSVGYVTINEDLMAAQTLTCPKCRSAMEAGIHLDKGH